MYTIYNETENKKMFEGTEREFIDFVTSLVEENKHYNFSILGISDAIEYVENYGENLKILKK